MHALLYNKPSNREQGPYHPLHVPSRPWESISMGFVGGLPTTKKGNDYLFVVVDRFNKMCVLMPYKNTIDEQEATKIVLWTSLGTLWDTKEHRFRNGYKISQCILEYIMGEHGYEVEDI